MFGRSFRPMDPDHAMAPAIESPAPVTPRRGLFGGSAPQPMTNPNPVREFLGGMVKYQRPNDPEYNPLSTIGATLQDVAAGLRGGQGGAVEGLQRRSRNRAAEIRAEMDQKARAEALAGAMGPDGQFDANLYLTTLGQAGIPLDVADIAKAQEAGQQYDVLNTSDGPYRYNRASGEGEYQAGPLDDQRRQLLEAQIEAAKAEADRRAAQGGYYDARARQPYAPQRARAAPSNKPPAGFILD